MVSKYSSNSIQVQGTNDHSIVSKLSMAERGYLEDPFLKCFVKGDKIPKRSSLINRGYYIRSKVVRSVIQSFIQEMPKQKQIISLGAGFDTTYFCLQKRYKENKCWRYIEIDYPDVVERKIKLAKFHGLFTKSANIPNDDVQICSDASDGIQEKLIDTIKVYSCSNYLALGYDLRNVGGTLAKLLSKCGVDIHHETLFLSEVVLTYLTGRQSSKVINWIAYNFPNALTLIFEQMLPNDAFGDVMCKHFKSIGSPLLSIDAFSTMRSQVERHQQAGLNVCSHTDLYSYFYNLPKEERKRIENLEMFDEYEGWHLMCLHYFVLCSTNSSLAHLKKFCLQRFKQNTVNNDQLNVGLTSSIQCRVDHGTDLLKVYGHCMSSFNGRKKVLVVGGFGIHNSSHKRLNHISSIDLHTGHITTCPCSALKHTMFSTMVHYCNEAIVYVLFGGRAAPDRASNDLHFIQVDEIDCEKLSLNVVSYDNRSAINLPPARWRHSAIVFSTRSDTFSAQMVVVGGRDKENVFADCWKFCFLTRLWSRLDLVSKTNEQFSCRHSHSMLWWETKNKVVISGGLSESSQPLNDVLLLDPVSGDFERLKIRPSLPPRYSHTSHMIRDRLMLLVGGVSFTTYSNLVSSDDCLFDIISVVDLEQQIVLRNISFPSSFENHPIRVHCHTSFIDEAESGDFELTIVGGGSNCFSFGTAFTRTPLRFLLKGLSAY